MYITVPSVSYRYIVHHNIITLQLYYLLLVIRNRIDRFAIVRRKKKKKKGRYTTLKLMLAVFPYRIQYDYNWIVTRYFLFAVIIIYVQKRYAYSTISMLFIFIIIYARLQWARTYFPLPSPFFVIFRSPLRWLLSSLSSFSCCAFQLRYSLSFFPSLNQCCFFKLTKLRDIDSLYSDSERVSIVSFLLYISIPFPLSFYCLSKTFVCAFASRTKKDRFGKSRERNAAWNRFEENEQLEEAISFFVSSSFSFFLFPFLLDEKQKDLFYLDTRYIHIVDVSSFRGVPGMSNTTISNTKERAR